MDPPGSPRSSGPLQIGGGILLLWGNMLIYMLFIGGFFFQSRETLSLLACKSPFKPLHSDLGSWWLLLGHHGVIFRLSCFLIQVDVDCGLLSSPVHPNNLPMLKEICGIQGPTTI